MKIRIFTLKNVKYAAFNSHDSHCFEATVYQDGVRFCIASDDGWGGETQFRTLTNTGKKESDLYAEIEQINKELAETFGTETHERGDGSSFTMQNEKFEYIICNLVNDWLVSKDLRSLLKRKFVWQREDGEVRECRRLKEHTVEKMVEVIAKTEPTSKLLNAMPTEEALAIYRAI